MKESPHRPCRRGRSALPAGAARSSPRWRRRRRRHESRRQGRGRTQASPAQRPLVDPVRIQPAKVLVADLDDVGDGDHSFDVGALASRVSEQRGRTFGSYATGHPTALVLALHQVDDVCLAGHDGRGQGPAVHATGLRPGVNRGVPHPSRSGSYRTRSPPRGSRSPGWSRHRRHHRCRRGRRSPAGAPRPCPRTHLAPVRVWSVTGTPSRARPSATLAGLPPGCADHVGLRAGPPDRPGPHRRQRTSTHLTRRDLAGRRRSRCTSPGRVRSSGLTIGEG